MLGAKFLGFYERAHTCAQLPTGAVTNVITGIMNTVFARYQSDRERLSGACRSTLRVIMRTAVPLTLVLAIEIPRITQLLLGKSWVPIVGVLQLLVIYSICRPLLETVHAFLRAIGEARGMIGFAAVEAVVLLVATPLLADAHGIEGVAMGMNLVALIGATLGLRRIRRYVDVPWARTLAPPLLAGAAAAAIRLYAEGWIGALPEMLAMFVGGACFTICYVAFLLTLEGRALIAEYRTMVSIMRNEEQSL
jgi:O-antigen/teichoic acid export membrane protein